MHFVLELDVLGQELDVKNDFNLALAILLSWQTLWYKNFVHFVPELDVLGQELDVKNDFNQALAILLSWQT